MSWRRAAGSCLRTLLLHFAIFAFNGSRLIAGSGTLWTRSIGSSSLAVDVLADALHRAFQLAHHAVYTRHIVAGEGIAQSLDLVLRLAASAGRNFVAQVAQCALGLVGHSVVAVSHLYLFLELASLHCVHTGLAPRYFNY